MNPILYPENQTTFETNGLGRLSEVVSCYVTEERNGQFELAMEYPVTGRHFAQLQERMIVYARHSDATDLQPFRIYRITKPLSGIVTVYARHISYDLSGIVCRPFTVTSVAQAMTRLSTYSINTNPFTFWTDKTTAAEFKTDLPFSIRSQLGGTEGSILDVYGGEYEWDHYTVKLHEHRGRDSGVTIRYGKNLTDLTAESEITDPVTAVVPFWKQDDEIVILPEWAVGEDLSHLTVLDMTEMIQQKPAVEQLRDSAEGWLQNHSSTVPKRNIKISFVQLWQTEEYKDIAPLQRVWLCDTVTVLHEPLGVEITTKVIKTKYDCLLERYVEMELGDVKDDLLDILEDNVKGEIVSLKQSLPSRSYVDQAVEYATQMISGGLGGHVVFNLNSDGEPQEILIMDTDDVTTAVNVIRMNQNGIGFSTTGYNGPFTTAWTIDGHFNADFITAGTMNANRIKAGILSDEAGRNHWNLLTGEFSLQAGATIGGETIDEKIDAANAYTDDQLAEFASTVNSSVANLQAQIDGQIETYYYDYEPTLNNQPASSWTTTDVMEAHEGDLFFWKSRGYAYRFMNDNGTWKWKMVQDTDITLALANAAAAQDTADHKRRVFTSQPVTPYDAGDLWMQGASGDILTCTRTRASGSYTASDWSKLNKYTDDSALTTFMNGSYASTINSIQGQIDQKIDTWYQTGDPSSAWTTSALKNEHKGDLWYNSTASVQKYYRWSGTAWQELTANPPSSVFNTIDTKRQIFVSQPAPPYAVGDLWVQGSSGDILRCSQARTSGSYNANDWVKASKYTDDTAVENLQIGGENLLRWSDFSKCETIGSNYNWESGGFGHSSGGNGTVSLADAVETPVPVAKVYRITGNTSGNRDIQQRYIPLESNTDYTFSAYIRVINGTTAKVFSRFWDRAGGKQVAGITDNFTETSWVRWSTVKNTGTMTDGKYDFSLGVTGSSADIEICAPKLEKGSKATDWSLSAWDRQEEVASLNDWIDNDFEQTISEVRGQIDQKAETWYQSTDPAASWTAAEKAEHKGDLWYNTSAGKSYTYSGSGWIESDVPQGVYNKINGKAQIFTAQPTPPYSKGDLWFQSATSDIMTCVTSRASGNYAASDWQKRNKYTDDSALNTWIAGDYAADILALENQIDGKVDTWYQTSDPSSAWTSAALKTAHTGDLWYNSSSGVQKYYRWNGSAWQELTANPPAAVFNQISGKAQIFTGSTTPTGAASGDLWFKGASEPILTYVNNAWVEYNKYTDDTAVENLEIGGRNMLLDTGAPSLTAVAAAKARYFSDSNNTTIVPTYISLSDAPVNTSYGTQYVSASATGTDAGRCICWYSGDTAPMVDGQKYIISVYARVTSGSKMRLIFQYGVSVYPKQTIDITNTSWKRYSWTFTYSASGAGDTNGKGARIYIGARSYYAGTLQLCGYKLEKGNKATDWTLAPEDSAAEVRALSTYIDGSFKNTIQGLIDGKAETYFQTADPKNSWASADYAKHEGDLWYNSTASVQKYYRWNGSEWEELTASPPAAVFNTISGKANIFTGTATPASPNTGDLWFKGADEPILTFVGGSWVEYNKYTDNTAVTALEASVRADSGGDNLLLDVYTKLNRVNAPGTKYISDSSNTGTTYQFIDAAGLPDPNATCFLRLSNATGQGVRALAFYNNSPPPLLNGHYYSMSCYARSTTGPTTLRLRFSSNDENNKNFTVTENWEKYEYTAKFVDSGSTSDTYKRTYFYFRPTAVGQSLDMCGFCLKDVTEQFANYETVNDNLLPRTKDLAAWARYAGVTLEKDPEEDVNMFHFPSVTSVAYRDVTINQPGLVLPYALVRNKTVTLSYWIKVATASEVSNVGYAVFTLTTAPGAGRTKYSSNVVPSYCLKNTTEWQKISFTITITDAKITSGSGTITDDLYFYIQFYNHSTSESWMKKPKLEFGSFETEWCKSKYDDLPGGGRNLLKGSKLNINNSTTYNIAVLYFGDQRPVEGEPYVLQIKGSLGSDRVGWGVYNSGGTVYEGNYNADNSGGGNAFYDSATGVYTLIIPSWKIVQGSTTAANDRIALYQFPKTGASSASSIEWVKLEKGTVPTDWTPAPEDVEEEIESAQESADAALSRFGTCTTAAGTAAKAVSCPTFTLSTGAVISVLFTNKNSVANPTMNVNSTGAKGIRFRSPYSGNLEALTATSNFNWIANSTVDFQYDGTYWIISDSNSTLDQTRVFNALTKNQANQGVYLDNGNCYVNASYIKTGTLAADRIGAGTITGNHIEGSTITADKLDANVLTSGHLKLYGDMNVYKDETDLVSADNIGGRIGYAEGHDGTGVTRGVRMSNKSGSFYYIVTDSGVRMTANGANPKDMYVSGDGPVMRFDANRTIFVSSDGPTLKYQNTKLEVHHGTFVNVGSTQTSLGSNTYKWSAVYASTATIQSSDRKQKYNVNYDIDRFVKIFDHLKPASFKLKDGQSGRTHLGMIAQDVEEAMKNLGIDSMDFAAFIKEKVDGEYLYGLRYEEFIPILIAKVQDQQKQIDELKERVSDLEKTD